MNKNIIKRISRLQHRIKNMDAGIFYMIDHYRDDASQEELETLRRMVSAWTENIHDLEKEVKHYLDAYTFVA